jgi:hypothetical protein
MFSRTIFALAICFLFCAGNAAAQSVEEEKERAVVEVGAAAFRTVTGDSANSFGPSVAIEITPVKKPARTGIRHDRTVPPSLHRVGNRPFVQEAVGHFAKGGIYVWHRAGMESLEPIRNKNQFRERGSRGRFHVLALSQTQIRLVSRTDLRIQLCAWP